MYETILKNKIVDRKIDSPHKKHSQYKKNVLQCTVSLEAKTYVSTDKKGYEGIGSNNGADKDSVLQTIGNFAETRWITYLPSPANPLGACAEPHALAQSLQNVKEDERIESILQYPAIAQKEEMVGGIKYNKNDIVPGCATCQQWAPGLGDNGQNSYVKIPIDRSRERVEKAMIKYQERNRQLGADIKETQNEVYD